MCWKEAALLGVAAFFIAPTANRLDLTEHVARL
jgi:hypothetical protein